MVFNLILNEQLEKTKVTPPTFLPNYAEMFSSAFYCNTLFST